jgi:phosphopantothenoylcysteine decarboxylase/phosphopantothenate--cysteine ligase
MASERMTQVLLLISGGIAAYKTPQLVRDLNRAGHEVRCAVTPAAERMVSTVALAAVSNHRVTSEMFVDDGSMPHIDLARWPDVVLVAPATADCLAKYTLGLADNVVQTLLLAVGPTTPVLVAPAMNTTMWLNPAVQQHLPVLNQRGVTIIDPVDGHLACGETGAGAMADLHKLVEAVTQAAAKSQ